MLTEVYRFTCRFSYPAIRKELKRITGEDDWMGFDESEENPLYNFYEFVRDGRIEKDGHEIVIYLDM